MLLLYKRFSKSMRERELNNHVPDIEEKKPTFVFVEICQIGIFYYHLIVENKETKTINNKHPSTSW